MVTRCFGIELDLAMFYFPLFDAYVIHPLHSSFSIENYGYVTEIYRLAFWRCHGYISWWYTILKMGKQKAQVISGRINWTSWGCVMTSTSWHGIGKNDIWELRLSNIRNHRAIGIITVTIMLVPCSIPGSTVDMSSRPFIFGKKGTGLQ